MNETKRPILWELFIGVVILLGIVLFAKMLHDRETVEPVDVSYDTITLDSIKTTIDSRDTVIYNLNVKYKDDVEKSRTLSDSASVELFKELLTK